MNFPLSDLTTPQIVTIACLILIAAVVIVLLVQKNRTARLLSKFGEAEYARAVAERGDRSRAEAFLERREKRVGKFHLRTLSAGDRLQFEQQWDAVQARFVDGPAGAVTEADALLADVMAKRGYPVSDFETRAADISVDHPVETRNYRLAHEIAVRHLNGHATTEDLRRAMIHYRVLFEDLIDEPGGLAPKMDAKAAELEYQSGPAYRAR